MKATGIVRRIDDLGRVVIPKEIRRTMRIREGDPLEIFTNAGGEVIFKKYSPIGELSVFAVQCAEAIAGETKLAVAVCDRDHCIAAAGMSKKEALERRVTPDLESATEGRKCVTYNAGQNIIAFEGVNKEALVVAPIISGGDVCGAVVLLANETEKNPTESDCKIAQVTANFLGKQIES